MRHARIARIGAPATAWLAVLLTVAVLVAAVVACRDVSRSPYHSGKSTEQLWANALWLSVRAIDDPALAGEFANLFVSAIERAERKAPLYVSYGRADGGTWRIKASLDSFVAALAIEGMDALADPSPEPRTSWQSRLERQLGQSLRKLTSRVVTGATAEDHLEAMTSLLSDGSHLSQCCFLAAVAEDPDYLPGWYFLATRSTGETRAWALEQWGVRDFDNALPLYLMACDLLDDDAPDWTATLRLIDEGHRCRGFRIYAPDDPTVAPEAVWPETLQDHEPDFGDYDSLIGQPVTRLGLLNLLRHLDERWAFSDPVPRNLRRLGFDLIDAGRAAFQDGEVEHARRLILSAQRLGAKLMHVRPIDIHLYLEGRGIYIASDTAAYGFAREMMIAEFVPGDGERRLRCGTPSSPLCEWILRNDEIKQATGLQQLRGDFDYFAWEQANFEFMVVSPPRWQDAFSGK